MKNLKPKKKSSDYEIFSFRTTSEEREELITLLEKAKKRINPAKGSPKRKDLRVITYNRMIIYLLKDGLPKLKREDFEA